MADYTHKLEKRIQELEEENRLLKQKLLSVGIPIPSNNPVIINTCGPQGYGYNLWGRDKTLKCGNFDNNIPVLFTDKIIIIPQVWRRDVVRVQSHPNKFHTYQSYDKKGNPVGDEIKISDTELQKRIQSEEIDLNRDELIGEWYEYNQSKGSFTLYELFYAIADVYENEGVDDGNVCVYEIVYNPKSKKIKLKYNT